MLDSFIFSKIKVLPCPSFNASTILFLTVVVCSCADHNVSPPTTERTRPKQETVAYTGGSVFFVTKLEYDKSNRVVLATYNFRHNVPGSSDTIQSDRGIYTYDIQNRLIRYDYQIDYHLFCCVKPLLYGKRIDIAYDGSGKSAIIDEYQALSDFGDFDALKKKRVELDLTNRVTKEITIDTGNPSQYSSVYTYANGNLVKAEFTNSRTLYEYDTSTNPYHGLSSNSIVGPPVQSSRNNLTKQTTESLSPDGKTVTNVTTTVYENSYNEKGLLVKSVSTTTPPTRGSSSLPNTRLFTYEAY